MSWGPGGDAREGIGVLLQASREIRFDRVLADRGHDAEYFHVICRQWLGIRSTVIPTVRSAGSRKWPTTKYRRQLRRRFPKRVYRQRAQVESVFSRLKRRFGSILRARSRDAQTREALVRVLTFNASILAAVRP